jgi:hypothetical protein
LLANALAAAAAIVDEDARAWALAALAPHLPDRERAPVLAEAVAAARAIGDDELRARTLAALAPHLREGEQPEALSANRLVDGENRAESLAKLAPRLSGSAQILCTQLFLDRAALIHRREVLLHLPAFWPIISAMGGTASVEAVGRASLDTGAWWP